MYGLLEASSAATSKRRRRQGQDRREPAPDLELRLDNVMFRLGFADTRNEARQLVRHGHFTRERPQGEHPVAPLKAGRRRRDQGALARIVRINEALEAVDRRGIPQWLELDKGGFKGTVKTLPAREDITMPIQEQLIVELYSK